MKTPFLFSRDRRGVLSGNALKGIACALMFIDHIGAVVLRYLIFSGVWTRAKEVPFSLSPPDALYVVCRLIGRCAFPLFLFLLVEGAAHSRSRLLYALRLFLFGLLSEIPFDLGISHTLVNWKRQNVMFTLFLSLLSVSAFQWAEEKKRELVYMPEPASNLRPRLLSLLYTAFPWLIFLACASAAAFFLRKH